MVMSSVGTRRKERGEVSLNEAAGAPTTIVIQRAG